jgi:hypothetical protein
MSRPIQIRRKLRCWSATIEVGQRALTGEERRAQMNPRLRAASDGYLTATSCTSKTSAELGGISGGLPCGP